MDVNNPAGNPYKRSLTTQKLCIDLAKLKEDYDSKKISEDDYGVLLQKSMPQTPGSPSGSSGFFPVSGNNSTTGPNAAARYPTPEPEGKRGARQAR